MSLWRYWRREEGQRQSRMAANLWVLVGIGVAGMYILRRSLVGQGKSNKEKHGAFIQYLELSPPPPAPPLAPPLLANLTFAVKDVFDVEGFVSGFGNPTWAETHQAAVRTAHAVSVLVEKGATCVGKTHMDEMAYSISGHNIHYGGGPDNPAAPSRLPGGSSSGSAVAVAAGYVDFALGTDTGGSVRIPAAFCAVFGFRPTHGAVSTVGVIPMAQSFDTVGWFARDAATLRAVGQVLLGSPFSDSRPPKRFLIADDLFKIAGTGSGAGFSVAVVCRTIEKLFGKQLLSHSNLGDYLAKFCGLKLADAGTVALEAVRDAMRLLQAHEFKTNHEEWVREAKPKLGPGVSERVQAALGATTSKDALTAALKVKKDVQLAMASLLGNDVVLVLPTSPGPPPKKSTRLSLLEDFRAKAFTLLNIAAMSGCCQVSVPLGYHDGLPVSVSFMARPGADHLLLDTLVALFGTLQELASAADVTPLVSSSNKEAAEAAKDQGNAAFKKENYHGAIKLYSEAIRLDGANPSYYTNRAYAHMKLFSFKDVVADCTKAISLDKKSVKAYYRRAKAREFLGHYREAELDYQQVLVLEPTNRDAQEAHKNLRKSLYQ